MASSSSALPPRGDTIAARIDAGDGVLPDVYAPNDLYVSPDVRVEFDRVPSSSSSSGSYSDENAIVMRLVPALRPPADANPMAVDEPPISGRVRVMCLLPGSERDELRRGYDDRSTWFELQPWHHDQFLLVLGRIYHVLDRQDGAFAFDVRPPDFRDVATVRHRSVKSHAAHLHRMLLGSER